MEICNEEVLTGHLTVAELSSALNKTQHDLTIAQKLNKSVLSELKTWKERALKLESNLKQEKRNNQKNITQLGFKMLQFENHLRKEQRDIESKFIDKENQVKALEDVISSLHSRIKKNSLCYNCFVVKHNSPEHCVSPDSYSTKFPLDMDFSDYKPGNHGVLDTRSRSISLPLTLQSQVESPKVNNELCFHHMLSPVPEELEISMSEHAKRSIKELDTAEYEDIEEEKEIEEDMGITEEGNEDNLDLRIQVTESQDDANGNIIREKGTECHENQLITESYEETTDLKLENKHIESGPIDNEKDGEDNAETDLKSNERSCTGKIQMDARDEKGVDDLALPLNTEMSGDELDLDKNLEIQKIFPEDENSLNLEVHSVVTDIVSRVEQLMEHRHNVCVESVSADEEKTGNSSDDVLGSTIPQNISENDVQAADKECGGNKMPLSPKSEAIVAELKRAIFDASIELEKRHEVVNQATSSNYDRTVKNDVFQCRTVDDQQNENSKGDSSKTFHENMVSNDEKSNEVGLELNDDLSVNKKDGILLEKGMGDINPDLDKVDSSVSEQCVDTLTEYDVIELD